MVRDAIADEKLAQLRSELAIAARRVFNRGLVAGTGGNVSVRVPGTSEALITRTGVSLGDVKPEDILRVDAAGRLLDPGGAHRPSMETPIHVAGYRLRPDRQAVIHLHPPHTIAMSLAGQPLPLVTTSARLLLRHVPCIPVAYPETDRLHRAMEAVFARCPEANVVLMQAHGLTAYGQDLADAFNLADLCEATAQQAYLARTMGLDYRLPEPEELEETSQKLPSR